MKKNTDSSIAVDVKFIFSLILAVFIAVNAFHLFLEIKKNRQQKQAFYGFKFNGLQLFLKGEKFLGYFSDRDMADKNHAAQYAQAQYALAPLILDLDYAKHRYILFDCTTEETALKKIKELRLVPFKRNRFGIILARKK